MWPPEVFSSTFLMKGSIHLSPPMKRYVATFASQGSNLEKRERRKRGGVDVSPPTVRTHARVRKGMYMSRGMQIICCSARMAFMDCWTV